MTAERNIPRLSGLSGHYKVDGEWWKQLTLFDDSTVVFDVTPEPGAAVYACSGCGEYRYLSTKNTRKKCVFTPGCKGHPVRVKTVKWEYCPDCLAQWQAGTDEAHFETCRG